MVKRIVIALALLVLAGCTATGSAVRSMGLTMPTGLDTARFEKVLDRGDAVAYVCRPAFCTEQQVVVALFEPSGEISEAMLRSGEFPAFTARQMTQLTKSAGAGDGLRFTQPLRPVSRRAWVGFESEAQFADTDGTPVYMAIRAVVRGQWTASYASLAKSRRLAQANLDAATRPLTGG